MTTFDYQIDFLTIKQSNSAVSLKFYFKAARLQAEMRPFAYETRFSSPWFVLYFLGLRNHLRTHSASAVKPD